MIRSAVLSRSPARRAPGDGVVAGAGTVAGRPVFVFAQDASFAGGSLGAVQADSIVRVLRLAREAGAPVVGLVESGGARLDDGAAALDGYGRIFREHVAARGVIPQLSVITGTAAGGGAYAPALTDLVVMTEESSMFLTGPGVVREVTGEAVGAEDLGGPRVHGRNGVCDLVVPDVPAGLTAVRELLALLPSNTSEPPPLAVPVPAPPGDPGRVLPPQARQAYDVRAVARLLLDGGDLLELAPRWARNMVVGLGRMEGRPVGVIANQPRHLGGVIDTAAARKGARFVELCDRFGLPLIVLCDTPGFLPGAAQERDGIIRAGSELVRAFAGARVPRLTVVVRKAYGGGMITMNSKGLGADFVYAWPQAEIGIMGAAQAVGIVHRRELAAAPEAAARRDELARDYAEANLTAEAAARDGHVDEVIAPADTRDRLAWALGVLAR